MKNWLELIPIYARVHKRGSRMTRTCIALAVFLMAALFGMADRYLQGERAWQIRTYGSWQFTGDGAGRADRAPFVTRSGKKGCAGLSHGGGAHGRPDAVWLENGEPHFL